MGRLLKRVSLDFDYPTGEVWEGYLNPHYKECSHCENGYTPARRRLQGIVHLLMLSGSDSLRGRNHPYFDSISRIVSGFDSVPTKEMGDLTTGLAGRSCDRMFGHDACDQWGAERKIIEAAGLDSKWGICQHCDGEGVENSEEYKAWEEYEPPTGEGYQLWENTSEGSPQSPVFSTLDELCTWCEDNATTFGASRTSKEEWRRMLDDDFVYHKEGNAIFL